MIIGKVKAAKTNFDVLAVWKATILWTEKKVRSEGNLIQTALYSFK